VKLDRVKAIYDEISRYEIKLEPDPRSLGPLYLQNVIAECRNYLNAVSRVQLEVHREKQELARSIRAAETSYEVAFAELLSNDERVRRLPSIEDRKATANVILREQLNTLSGIKGELQDLEFVEKAIRHRHKELTATMTEIKLQRSLIRDEIDSGAMYGDERRSDHERGPGAGPLGEEIDEAELDELLNREQEAVTKVVEEVPTPPPAPPVSIEKPSSDVSPADEEAAVKAFLGEPTEAAVGNDDDFASILDQV
jgi:hypothetical protein